MEQIRRRSFLQSAAATASATSLLGRAVDPVTSSKPSLVLAGTDRLSKSRTVGVSATTYKVLTAETAGAMFVMEQANAKKGGPNRHLHFAQDELFNVLEGEYIVEVGSERYHLRAGDCVLGPRQVPHSWAFVGESTGRLLLSYCPAGKMEEFFNHRDQIGIAKGAYTTANNADTLRTYGMEYIGPPLKIDG